MPIKEYIKEVILDDDCTITKVEHYERMVVGGGLHPFAAITFEKFEEPEKIAPINMKGLYGVECLAGRINKLIDAVNKLTI